MKYYRRHNCLGTHRRWDTLARCIWPRARWIDGDGEFATVSYCNLGCHVPDYRRGITVELHKTQDGAVKALAEMAKCGATCNGNHDLIRLVK